MWKETAWTTSSSWKRFERQKTYAPTISTNLAGSTTGLPRAKKQ